MAKTPSQEDRELSALLKQLRKTYLEEPSDSKKKKKADKESEADRKFQEQLAKMLGAISDPIEVAEAPEEAPIAEESATVESPAAEDMEQPENPPAPQPEESHEEAPTPPKKAKKCKPSSDTPKKKTETTKRKAKEVIAPAEVAEPITIPEPMIFIVILLMLSMRSNKAGSINGRRMGGNLQKAKS